MNIFLSGRLFSFSRTDNDKKVLFTEKTVTIWEEQRPKKKLTKQDSPKKKSL